jgi:hypothetical protein
VTHDGGLLRDRIKAAQQEATQEPAAQADAINRPRVIEAIPDDDQTGVDPNLSQIRVTFDQPMDTGGFSWVGGGPSFPQTRGKPRWINDRTCILPVQLEPNKDYWLSINSNRFQNFRSKAGIPAEPYPITFHTGSGGGQ